MSFVITMYVREGIVMASDSRLTLNSEQQSGDKQVNQIAVGASDSNYKTFLTDNRIGISTFAAADIKGVPIAGYMESFIRERLNSNTNVEQVPQLLLEYFRSFDPIPKTGFHVAGYQTSGDNGIEQHVWGVDIAANSRSRIGKDMQGASWGGEGDILARILNNVGLINSEGNLDKALPQFPIPYQFFTLQDAIDFAIFAVRSTIDIIRFQPRPKTVGGPIDVLVIKPDKAFWVQKKELHGH
jgi:hypothetical protein